MRLFKDFIMWYARTLAEREEALRHAPAPPATLVTQTMHVDLQAVTPVQQLILRLGWHRNNDWWGGATVVGGDNNLPPYCSAYVKHLSVYSSEEKVFITLMAKDGTEPVTLDDEKGLFPSDALVATIQLLTA